MDIDIRTDAQAVAVAAADAICAAIQERPDAWLGLPTGNTPILTYKELIRRAASGGGCDVSEAIACAIDEFCGSSADRGTNGAFYGQHLRAMLGGLRCPAADATDPAAEIGHLAGDIRQRGGLDLCVLGVGENGHVAFNEPGSAPDSRARVVDLAETTRRAHADGFGGLDRVPLRGMTLGIADLRASRSVLVLATGAHKSDIVAAAIEGPMTAAVPASWLQDHPDVTWLLDENAARLLSPGSRRAAF